MSKEKYHNVRRVARVWMIVHTLICVCVFLSCYVETQWIENTFFQAEFNLTSWLAFLHIWVCALNALTIYLEE